MIIIQIKLASYGLFSVSRDIQNYNVGVIERWCVAVTTVVVHARTINVTMTT